MVLSKLNWISYLFSAVCAVTDNMVLLGYLKMKAGYFKLLIAGMAKGVLARGLVLLSMINTCCRDLIK